MDISTHYTQIQEDATIVRSGGIILKGRTRNTRQPVHMILAVDTSGSMEVENKLASVKRSISLMLSLLSADDRLSLVTFADDSKTFLNRVIPTTEERQAIQYRVSNLNADGSTNMSAGLLEVRGLVEPPSSGRKQGLILLTDGHANLGVHSEEGLIDILKRIQSESPGLSLTTVAYGVDHNAEMLTSLAKAGGGAYNVVTNLEDVATVFGDILGGLMSVSAQKVEVQLPPGATATTSYRTETDPAGMTTIYVGDLYADGEITILFKSAPSFGPLRIKGTDMTTLDPMDVISEPTLLSDANAIPLSLLMAEYRHKTITLLTTIRKVSRGLSGFLGDVEALIKQIEDDDRIRDHPLKAMLLEDLEQAKVLSRRGYLTQNETIEMAQHTAYLGISKGLRSTTTHVPYPAAPVRGGALRRQVAVNSLHNPDDAVGAGAILPPSSPPRTPPLLPSMTSPFANRMQSQIASVMRTMSMQPEDQENSQN